MNQETLSAALDICRVNLQESRGVLVNPDAIAEVFMMGGMRYDEVRRESFELATLKGKNTRSWFHIVITRLDSGRYESVSYCG